MNSRTTRESGSDTHFWC